MKLIDIARAAFYDAPGKTKWEKIYNAGWKNGEWTCCECGCMIGKNLKGESPYYLARGHAMKCGEAK